ncbi:MAG: dTDP-4-amino-4,6-dideoxygalactose transaminase [Erysipelotrichaceae bacterium]|nr:dTDP-4-amino-4,6-dideoxygalactose transaminase [Erysipelotrichaceae bacterium]
MVSFNLPVSTGKEQEYMAEAIANHKLCGDGPFTKKCSEIMENKFDAQKVLLTTSGTSALDMAFLLCDLKPGDEVILPSFTFSSTATAPLLANASLVFTDIDPKTMNIDPVRIEQAITDKTKVILVMHYAGVSCDMDKVMEIARKHHLIVVEDAAQAVMSSWKGKALGTIGDFGCYSFHETKNYTMGEGGAILINNPDYFERAEILREKGTDRSKFNRGQVDKYTWIDKGDSYLPSELNAAYLYPQLLMADEINNDRLASWNYYYEKLQPLAVAGLIELPLIPEGAVHNAHMFYIKTKDIEERTRLISYAKNHPEHPAQMVFHYVPLHSAPAGLKYGRFDGEDLYTTSESERLVRLPLYYGLTRENQDDVIANIMEFYGWKQN